MRLGLRRNMRIPIATMEREQSRPKKGYVTGDSRVQYKFVSNETTRDKDSRSPHLLLKIYPMYCFLTIAYSSYPIIPRKLIKSVKIC